MAKFYIATSLSKHEQHNFVRDYLVSLGHEITYDWTTHGSQKMTSLERLNEIGHYEMDAVKSADIVVVLLPGGKGTHAELGMALGLDKPVFLHSEDPQAFDLGNKICAFYCCDGVTRNCLSLDQCLVSLKDFMENSLNQKLSVK